MNAMASRWDDADAPDPDDLLGACVYTYAPGRRRSSPGAGRGRQQRGQATETDVHGDPVEVLWVKGSGWDMASIEPAGFAPLRLAPVARLAELERLSDRRMANELKAASIDTSPPPRRWSRSCTPRSPSLHAPHPRPDTVVALTNTPRATTSCARCTATSWSSSLTSCPASPGPPLRPDVPGRGPDATRGMVLLNHGLFTFADDAHTAYEHHVELVARAVAHLDAAYAAAGHDPHEPVVQPDPQADTDEQRLALAELRRDVSAHAGHPMVLCTCTAEATRRFAAGPTSTGSPAGHGHPRARAARQAPPPAGPRRGRLRRRLPGLRGSQPEPPRRA